ncbi:MAG TPA: protein-glutamate O-methyltransferase CheR [Terriglobales bacterium]|nr:protein-glutamate O-methyltransferase CheR [Terriglobales bacterium]
MPVEAAKSKLADPPGVTPQADARDPVHLKIRDLVYRISGIYHSEQKMYLLAASCSRRMSECGAASASDYLDRLTTGANRDAELKSLLNEITIGETYMFRHPAQLDAMSTVILPQIMKNKMSLGLKRLRIWSAGCSTGEEPYTLAMFLNEEKQLAGWTYEILATDLNTRSIDASKAGIYGEYALRNISEPLRRKYFKDAGQGKLEVNDLLRSRVKFDRVNLSDDSKMVFLKGIDVIFCCNVLIYFDVASKKRVVQHFFTNLLPGGYFFLGHAESLYQVNDTFQLVHFPGTTAYWKPTPGAAAGGKR